MRVVAADYGILPANDGVTNSANLNAAISTLSAAYGGVIDFLPTIYTFNGTITLRSGVFLRGAHARPCA